jgi:argininosuccinate lyase
MERNVGFAMATIAGTMAKLAFDACMFNCQNFGFVKLPKECTTGSSIMPHKKNPDVFELIRAHCNRINGIPGTIRLIGTNLPSGYFRDMQLIKEVFIPMFEEMDDCLDIAKFAIENMTVTKELMSDPRYQLAFSVEEVNRLVAEGVPFRDAYRQVGMEIQRKEFSWKGELHHTHEGSVGNLCTGQIAAKMDGALSDFTFGRVSAAVSALLA